MKLRRTYAYVVFKINDEGSQIVIDSSMTREESEKIGTSQTYEDFIKCMPKDQGRYGVYDLAYNNGLEGIRNRLIFVMW
jgi:cofilin